MDSGMIGKIEKSKRYAQERDRICFQSFKATLMGENGPHAVSYEGGEFSCDCSFFSSRGRCSHTMAMEIILEEMLTEEMAHT
jgi:hypothetical protein